MAFSQIEGTETVGTTEHSLTTDTPGPDADTTTCMVQGWINCNAIAAGEVFLLQGYEKVLSGGTQRVFMEAYLTSNIPHKHFPIPAFFLKHGWDFTLKKISGTDRSFDWSLRLST